MLEQLMASLRETLAHVLLPLVVTVGVTLLLLRLVSVAAEQIDRRFVAPVPDPDRRARLRTVYRAGKSTVQIAILAVATLIGLATLGINIGPALTAAGILGLAVSLGAQTLIKDFIGGLTILLEDEFRVGDSVRIGAVAGEVERITLRRTDLRDAEGRLFIVPNGDVRVLANETRDWARALVELNFSFDSDIKKAVAALEEALVKVAADPRARPHLLEPPEIFGWNGQTEMGVIVRLRAKTKAGKQGEVARVMREYALEAVRGAGVSVESRNRVTLERGSADAAP
ncbi:MAG: mechanosensitive ion channel family protein [Anaerolineae bacterium]|nr:mechanosensitive ion channel family protein [Anaerolineae bacterium]